MIRNYVIEQRVKTANGGERRAWHVDLINVDRAAALNLFDRAVRNDRATVTHARPTRRLVLTEVSS